ncbi:zinc-binding dehydrogenase [Amycolatopsis thermophila]|uniref:NADPH:quinone reductase-like Zn-dependent oxidoreductase n=1 Tax=Amycolatopsis thermophila TaxID=206084 RepID=A0ABU0EX53_9PSEU|nr:zinc-binding dehydrogenase [Amycolatopsis thermophila]MDQ0379688.1 NADPH:quinone reductase-like Zn-dependent oxidoreductase [Amycolatopsis thermophila]
MPRTVAGAFTAGTQTAYLALRQLGVSAGDTVLIHAAAGSVGTAAVQLARRWGATVIGTASEANQSYVRSLGAAPVVSGEGLAERVRALSPGGVHAALDGAGGEALDVSLALVKERGRVLTLVDHDRAEALGVQLVRGQRSQLDEAAQAHRDVETGHGRGKVVLTV